MSKTSIDIFTAENKHIKDQRNWYLSKGMNREATRLTEEYEQRMLEYVRTNHRLFPPPQPNKEKKKWKCITITNANNFSPEDINERLKKAFSNEKFEEYAACIEHISTNRHIHAVAKFTRESKWKPWDFRQYLEKYFPLPFDISKTDSRGNPHLHSKSFAQAKGFIAYVKKKEEDKVVFDFLSPTFT